MYNNIYICFNKQQINAGVILEYVMSFGKKFALKLAELNNLKSYTNDNMYIFIQKIPDDLLNNPKLCKNMILLNIEQMTTVKYRKIMTQVLNKNIKVIDYSIENINLINEFYPKSRIKHIPYQYEAAEVDKLEVFVKNTPKLFDIAFTGWVSPRRKKFLICLKMKDLMYKLSKINGQLPEILCYHRLKYY
jgi:hypothetical protein